MAGIRHLEYAALDPDLRAALRPRVDRLGYLGSFFAVMGHQPAALMAFDRFTEELKRALGPRLAELVALTVATRLGNDYERTQHERLALSTGCSPEWIAAVERLAPDTDAAPHLDSTDRCVQRFCIAAVDRAPSSADLLDDLVMSVGDAVASGAALLTARFVAHALVSAACRLEPMVPSIFEEPDA
jgi:alkylhydroperoxidase family enzyme